ncbi:hypothetical protein EAJSRFBN_CDS0122 [Salmonella phage SeKF_19]
MLGFNSIKLYFNKTCGYHLTYIEKFHYIMRGKNESQDLQHPN